MSRRAVSWVVFLLIALTAALPGAAREMKQRIAYQRERNGVADITVMYTDGSYCQDLPASPSCSGSRMMPTLSPDALTLAFTSKVGEQSKIFTWSLDESNSPVGEPQSLLAGSDDRQLYPAWSPDGTQLAFLSFDAAHNGTLRLVKANGSDVHIVSSANYPAPPAWRPDGKELLYIDLVNHKPVLMNVPLNGRPIALRQQVIAACYAPDGKKIAALIHRDSGQCDLWIIPPFGATGGRKIASNISGAKEVAWPSANTIIYNAASPAGRHGKERTDDAFWMVDATGKTVKALRGFTDPKLISYFSIRRVEGVATAATPTVPVQPRSNGAAANGHSDSPVSIVSPVSGATVRGRVPVKIVAQPGVSSIVVSIGDQFTATQEMPDTGAMPQLSFNWDTQQFLDLDPVVSKTLPIDYSSALRYPDGTYTIRVLALDDDYQLKGEDTITVSVKNSLSGYTLPPTLLRYSYNSDENIAVHGEGALFGIQSGLGSDLNATLDTIIHRKFVESLPGGYSDLRSTLKNSTNFPLTYGARATTIPESSVSALYSLSSRGDLAMIRQEREKVYLPLSQLAVPFSAEPVVVGSTWKTSMWVVADLLDREATRVDADNVIEGVEWIGTRRAVRIRSDFFLNADRKPQLSLSPTTILPELRGTRSEMQTSEPTTTAPTNPMDMVHSTNSLAASTATTTAGVVDVTRMVGRRYAWFDYERHALLRVEDFMLYSFPVGNLTAPDTSSAQASPAGGNAPGPSGIPGAAVQPPSAGGGPPGGSGGIPAWVLARMHGGGGPPVGGPPAGGPPSMVPPAQPSGGDSSNVQSDNAPKPSAHAKDTAWYLVRYTYNRL